MVKKQTMRTDISHQSNFQSYPQKSSLTASKKTPLLYKCALVTKCQNSTVIVFRNENRCSFKMQTCINKNVSLSTQMIPI